MMLFTPEKVREFTDSLEQKMAIRDNGEGLECYTAEAIILQCVNGCCELHSAMRSWGRDVFAARVAFDKAAEEIWLKTGTRVLAAAKEALSLGEQLETPCFVLSGLSLLKGAISDLEFLMNNWVTPKPSVAPSPRHGICADEQSADAVCEKVQSLAKLPPTWEPINPQQQQMFRIFRR